MSQNPSLRRAAQSHATRSHFADKYGYGTAGSDQIGADERMMGAHSNANTAEETAGNQNSLPEINIKQSN
jgi:hypothetical protein